MAKAILTIYGQVGDGPMHSLAAVDIESLRANARPLVAELFHQLAAAVEDTAGDSEPENSGSATADA
ncbi:hypothetical protein [Microbispora sp. CA-102843]|uniref:hypothetical protein n=1 Tax=Microbispora sp. CA-102843 TaxID=3239952 RepID=UPI003D93CA02